MSINTKQLRYLTSEQHFYLRHTIMKLQTSGADKAAQEILDVFPEIMDVIVPEIGFWYRTKSMNSFHWIAFIEKIDDDGDITVYGKNIISNEWSNDQNLGTKHDDDWIPATKEEVSNMMLEEATMRGFVPGAKVKSAASDKVGIINNTDLLVFHIERTIITATMTNNSKIDIFRNGKWGTVLEEAPPPPSEKSFSDVPLVMGTSGEEPSLLPENLGNIEFLREHPAILAKLIERSRDKSLDPFIIRFSADESHGGFSWGDSEEGAEFWNDVLSHEKTNVFYKKYPRDEESEKKTIAKNFQYPLTPDECISASQTAVINVRSWKDSSAKDNN